MIDGSYVVLRIGRSYNAVAIWPVTGQGFENTKWPAVDPKKFLSVTKHGFLFSKR